MARQGSPVVAGVYVAVPLKNAGGPGLCGGARKEDGQGDGEHDVPCAGPVEREGRGSDEVHRRRERGWSAAVNMNRLGQNGNGGESMSKGIQMTIADI